MITLLDYIFEEEITYFDKTTAMLDLQNKVNACRELGIEYILANDEKGNVVLSEKNVVESELIRC